MNIALSDEIKTDRSVYLCFECNIPYDLILYDFGIVEIISIF